MLRRICTLKIKKRSPSNLPNLRYKEVKGGGAEGWNETGNFNWGRKNKNKNKARWRCRVSSTNITAIFQLNFKSIKFDWIDWLSRICQFIATRHVPRVWRFSKNFYNSAKNPDFIFFWLLTSKFELKIFSSAHKYCFFEIKIFKKILN